MRRLIDGAYGTQAVDVGSGRRRKTLLRRSAALAGRAYGEAFVDELRTTTTLGSSGPHPIRPLRGHLPQQSWGRETPPTRRPQCAFAPSAAAFSALRSRKRWILPLGVFGSSATKAISRG